MKRIIMLVAAVLMVSTAVTAQKTKINAEKLLKNIAKSDVAIENPKKASNVDTWLDRAELFYDAEIEVSKNMLDGWNEKMVEAMLGRPASKTTAEIGSRTYNVRTYPPYITAYYTSDAGTTLFAWELKPIYEGAIEKSIEAYLKARELDVKGKKTKQINEGLKMLFDAVDKNAYNEYNLAHYEKSANFFVQAFSIGELLDTARVSVYMLGERMYNAGLAYQLAGLYDKSLKSFESAVEHGYENDGDIYYLQYYAYRGKYDAIDAADSTRTEERTAIMQKAKNVLEFGLAKYPSNERTIECLTDAYMELGEDPDNIINVVKEAVAKMPDNPSLWYALARIYDNKKDWDNAIDALNHMAAIQPDNAGIYYSIGLLYNNKATEIYLVASNKMYSSQAEFDAATKEFNDVFLQAVAPLERSYELDPTNRSTVEMLKSITFRLRNLPEMSEKNAKYTEILNTMP